MKIKSYVNLATAIVAAGILLSPGAYAGGRHHGHWNGGHGGGHYYGGDSFSFGLGFVLPIYSYGYPYGNPYGYPYYGPPPVYPEPAQSLPPVPQNQPSYTASQEEPAYCREYSKKIIVNGKEEVAYGTACLQDDGSWRIMN